MKKIIKIVFLLLIPAGVFAQLAPVTNQYILNPLTINPAYAGNRGALNIAAFYRKQWAGIKGAPETMTLTVDAPFFDKKVGFGLIVMNDKIGVTKETHILSNYAYKISLGQGSLSFGLAGGVTTTNTAYNELIVLDPGDESYLLNSGVHVVPSLGFGSYYTYKNFFMGFSIPKLLGYRFDLLKNKYTTLFAPGKQGYMLSAGYVYNLSSKVRFFPSTLLTYASQERLQFDINAHFNYLDRFWAGISYRNNRSVAGLFQVQLNSQLRIAYTYDIDFGKLQTYSYGSHEIMLRYEFRYKVDVVNPLIF